MSERPLLLSVVVPTVNEQGSLGLLLGDIGRLKTPHEVIVVDGGSTDLTTEVAWAAGARVLSAPPGRGVQLRAGADAASAPLFLFLHADVRLGERALALLDEIAVARPPCAIAFRLRIDARGLSYRVIEWGTNLRSRLLALPYGDQGLVVRREDYVRAGGYPAIPLMEDVALLRALRTVTHVHLVDAAVRVSARRWEAEGPLRRTLKNWVLLARFLAGTPPERLARRYRAREGSAHGGPPTGSTGRPFHEPFR
ncbi:MAG: TIGR04283 family arsenosugar biosynthesis glycosyltransferase [Longimicrobiales bacterium]